MRKNSNLTDVSNQNILYAVAAFVACCVDRLLFPIGVVIAYVQCIDGNRSSVCLFNSIVHFLPSINPVYQSFHR